ncbi:ATP-binding cassette domain-containing protein [Halovenus sp. WSH3]|uniref:ATP-binding cassette domain-containing protein n=1 Tax=Halovenus carboxidivorans TaxID=2692199 RepID=A0A6B0SZ72_9EURY|nr:ATP-binding cassette domain-containing protein [Halovenus carboxidivorans]
MTAIELSSVTKRFGPVTAVDDLTLAIEDGEIFGFLGPNGAGKSTVISLLLDFIRPTAGTVRVLGRDAQAESLAVRERTGVLPDAYHVYDRLTGRQHVDFAIRSKGTDDDPDALLERVGIEDAGDRKAGTYSKGMAQRLMLATALVGTPELLVFDEPTTGLDPTGAREMRDIIRAERDRGATVFFSSHSLHQVEAVCDRVGILNRGRLVALDSVAGLRERTGGGARLRITADQMSDAVLNTLRSQDGVTAAEADGQTLLVTCDPGAKADVIATLRGSGVDVVDFATETTSLEDLFIDYTTDERAAAPGEQR